MSDVEEKKKLIGGVPIDELSDKATAITEVMGHASKFRPIDPPPGEVKACPYCSKENIERTKHEDAPLGEFHCKNADCHHYFDVRSGLGGERHLRSFIVNTDKGPKLVIGPQHLEHMLETGAMEIPAAGWFGNANVGVGHALKLSTIPEVTLDEIGVSIKDMDVILITSSVWHHKQYAKASGYFLYYHPDAIFSDVRRADLFLATKLGLLLDNSDKQKVAILEAYLKGNYDTVKTAADISRTAINNWSLGDESSRPVDDNEGGWYRDWQVWVSLIFLIVAIATATKVWGLW